MTTQPNSRDAVTQSFPALESEQVHVLVLGTMPGVRSIETQQYYAHARNAFWPIVVAFCENRRPRDFSRADSYEDRVARVTRTGIAVWDVLARCERPGSLDSAIVRDSEVPNDLVGFAQRHPELERVVFNGKTAERLFTRHVLKTDAGNSAFAHIALISAPSTSPAMASLSLAQKYEHWSRALGNPAI